MATEHRNKAAITAAESLESLAPIVFQPEKEDQESELRRTDLLQSVLNIAGMDTPAESKLVHEAVINALGVLPE